MPLYFEDVAVGDELPPVVRPAITHTQLVMSCAAGSVSDPIHYDPEIARASGFPDLVANSSLRVAFLAQLLTDWVMPEGTVERLGCEHRGLVLRGDPVTSRGRVTRKYLEGGNAYLECEIWNETPRVGRTDVGTAVVTLPHRGGPATVQS